MIDTIQAKLTALQQTEKDLENKLLNLEEVAAKAQKSYQSSKSQLLANIVKTQGGIECCKEFLQVKVNRDVKGDT